MPDDPPRREFRDVAVYRGTIETPIDCCGMDCKLVRDKARLSGCVMHGDAVSICATALLCSPMIWRSGKSFRQGAAQLKSAILAAHRAFNSVQVCKERITNALHPQLVAIYWQHW